MSHHTVTSESPNGNTIQKTPVHPTKPRVKFFKIVGNYRVGVLKFVVQALRELGFVMAPKDLPLEKVHIFWSRSFGTHLTSLLPHHKVNFFPGMSMICRKDYLHTHITEASHTVGREYFDFWPEGFVLPKEMDKLIDALTIEPYPYILKPPLAARGEGIRIVSSATEIDPDDTYYAKKIPLAQKYIKDPLLFKGEYKMTFRLYVLLTGVDPIRLYVYRNGLVRICSEKYQDESYHNALIHLTNWDLQKDNETNFEAHMKDMNESDQAQESVKRDGLRSDLNSIMSILKGQDVDTEKIWKDIKALVAKSVLVVEKSLTRSVTSKIRMRSTAFELLGYDLLLDRNYKPWLLEINHTPSLSPHTDLENDIKLDMIRELMHVVDIQRKDIGKIRSIAEKLMSIVRSFQEDPPNVPSTSRLPIFSDDGIILWNHVTFLDIWILVETIMEQKRCREWIPVFPTADASYSKPLLEDHLRSASLMSWLERQDDAQVHALFSALYHEIGDIMS